MKIFNPHFTLSIILALPALASAQMPAGMTQEKMQQMMQNMQSMQSCMANVDQKSMQLFQQKS